MSVNLDYFTSCACKCDLDIGGNYYFFITVVSILHRLDTAVYLRFPSLSHINKSAMGILKME